MSGAGYIQHFAGRNYFVDKLFPPTCGGCGKKLRRVGNAGAGYLCRNCSPRLRPALKETSCATCKFLAECTARLGTGAWVRCELPNEGDLRRLLGYQEFSNPTTKSALESALAGDMDRMSLETEIGRSSERAYQRKVEHIYSPETQ